MKSIVFNSSGKIGLTKFVDGALSHTLANMSARNGTVERIQSNVTINTKDMPDGNSKWPMGSYDTGNEGSVVVTMSSYQPKLHAFLMGGTVSTVASRNMRVNDKKIFIPDSSPYTETLNHTPNDNITPIMVDESNTEFTKVDSAPAEGEFSISANEVTFNSADSGSNVFLTYDWTADSAEKLGLSSDTRPVMHAIISGKAVSEDKSTEYDSNIIIDKCQSVGEISVPEKGSEPQPWSFTLKVLRPRGDNDAVEYAYAQSS